MTERREIQRARQSFKGRRERNEDRRRGEGVDRINVSHSYGMKERKPLSPLLLLLFSNSFLIAGQAWNKERKGVKAEERKYRREQAKSSVPYLLRPSPPLPLTLLMPTHLRKV